MKIYILFNTIYPVENMNTSDVRKLIAENAGGCLAEYNAKPSDLEDFFNDTPSRVGKCLRYCLMKQYKVINDEGYITKEGMVNAFRIYVDGSDEYDAIAIEITDICNSLKLLDPCDSAYKLRICAITEAKAKGVPIEFV